MVFAVGELSAFAASEIARSLGSTRVIPIISVNDETARTVAEAIQPGDAVLIKGSRGMGLERLIPAMEARLHAMAGGVRKLSSEPRSRQAV